MSEIYIPVLIYVKIILLNEYEKKEKGNVHVSDARPVNKLGHNM